MERSLCCRRKGENGVGFSRTYGVGFSAAGGVVAYVF